MAVKTIDTLLLPCEERALRKGRRQGRDEGLRLAVEGLRSALLDVLEFRFQHVPDESRTRLNAINDLPALRRAQRLALSSPDLAGFLKSLGPEV
jgi:hypothetical protein